MKKIPVEEILDGSILAKDVYGNAGNILLGRGTPLSAAMGRRLKNWGIPVVFIEGEEDALEASSAEAPAEENIAADLSAKFEGHLDDPIMKQIHDAVLEFRTKRAAA